MSIVRRLFLVALVATPLLAEGAPAPRLQPKVVRALKYDLSAPLRTIRPRQPKAQGDRPAAEREIPIRRLPRGKNGEILEPAWAADTVRAPSAAVAPATPAPTESFEGIESEDNFNVYGGRVVPPDTNGDVGPNHYVQTVNLLLEIWDKSGVSQLGPIPMSDVFAGFGGPCEFTDDGDPIALYDPLADRWLLSQFVVSGPPFHQCIAISQTADPTGAYYRYDFPMPGTVFNDYPHFGVWPDAYYMSDNQFDGNTFAGAGAFAFDRLKMLQGDPGATYLYFDLADLDPTIGGMLPADADGPAPPAGAPGYFVYFIATEFGDASDGLRLFEFHADFATPANSTFLERASDSPLAVAAFDPICGSVSSCVRQPGGGSIPRLDTLSDRLMHRLQYRNSVGHESLVVSHTVDVAGTTAGQAGVRYYELWRPLPGGLFSVNEQASWSPPAGVHYWMPSAAMDHDGNLAVGYSRSGTGAADFPSLRYAARLASDPPNSLAQGEATLINGTGIQSDASERWGDYAALSVDPEDDCTFWFTSEYYTNDTTCPTASARCWHTRIGSFKLPACTVLPVPGTIQGVVRNQVTNAPISGAFVSANGYTTTSDGAGNYSLSVPAQTYAVQGSKFGYLPNSASGLVVTTGGTVTQDLLLPPVTLLAADSPAVDDTASNGNGVVESDECFDLEVAVAAIGGGDATGVSAVLSTSTPGVTVTQGASAYPDIAAGTQVDNSPVFKVSTAPGFLPGTPIAFNLQVSTDQGVFPLSFVLPTGSPNPTGSSFASAGAVAIPDGNPTGASVTLNVAGLTTPISKVRVALRITHTWDSDLQIQLIGPDNTTVTLAQSVGADGDNFGTDCPAGGNDTNFDDAAAAPIGSGSAPFVGTFQPQQALAAFSGKSGSAVNGAWKLKAIDSIAQDSGTIQCVTLTINGYLAASGGGACAGDAPAMTPQELAVDASGNGVLELGETVQVAPTWGNGGAGAASNLGGQFTGFNGPLGGPIYTIADGAAIYGSVASSASASCTDEGDCYQLNLSGSRPVQHWDSTVNETLTTGDSKQWLLHIGGSFLDVPPAHVDYHWIETVLHNLATLGCGANNYCPGDAVSREQLAMLLVRAQEHDQFYSPAACSSGSEMFPSDVLFDEPFCRWIEEAALPSRQILGSCDGADAFCPGLSVTRAQLAMFLLRTAESPGYTPPVCDGGDPFVDVTDTHPFCPWIQELKDRGLALACDGGGTAYCPDAPVTRQWLAAALSRAFWPELYKP